MRYLVLALSIAAWDLAAAQSGLPGDSLQVTTGDSTGVFMYGRARTYRSMLNEMVGLQLYEIEMTADSLRDPRLGIGRLVVDETLTRTGSYFYDVFYRLWQPPRDASFSSIVLSESPLPGQGTLVIVRLDGELIYQARLPPREEEAEAVARQAVLMALRRLPSG